MSTFYICSNCGYPRHNHNFRHPISEIKAYRNKNYNEESFRVDALSFPLLKSTKCGKQDCNGVIGIHNTPGLQHQYIPVEYKYRIIKLVLPPDAICTKCKITIDKHNTVMTHHFNTKISIENKQPDDKIFIINPIDEDKKIEY